MALDSRQILRNWLHHEGIRFYVPTYHNLVSRRLIDKVRAAHKGPYFFNPLPDFGTLIANLYFSEEVIFNAAPLSMTGHSGRSSGGTHGHQESWDRHLEKFIEESGWTDDQLLPSVFRPFLWAPPLLAGCFEDVKKRLFPDDESLSIDWGNFLISAAAGVNSEPEAARGQCREWLLESADRIGLPRDRLKFPEIPPYKRQAGTLIDPQGRIVYAYLDGDVLGLKTVMDAVRAASTLQPTALYPISVPGVPARVERYSQKLLGPILKPLYRIWRRFRR